MNPTGRTPDMTDTPDKLELHYRQQLSCLVDGELAADEARFMLRRIEHDGELASCQERWQMLGDVLRGKAVAPAPLDFSARVQAAIAADVQAQQPVTAAVQPKPRSGWRRWSGGAALAASVAAVALFMAREQLPDAVAPEPVIATAAQVSPPVTPAVPDQGAVVNDAAGLVAAVPAVAAAVARRQDTSARRGSATRTQQAARASVAARTSEPERAVASAARAPASPAAGALPSNDPFAAAGALQARPWPRSTLSQGGVFNASFPTQQDGATFYPFEPRLPAQDAGHPDLPRLPSRR